MKTLFASLFIVAALASCTEANSQTQNSTVAQDIEQSELESYLKIPNVLLLDVRTPQEVAQGMIEGAVNINFHDPDFLEQVQKYPKDEPIIIYCKSGGRSSGAMKMMKDAGYEQLYNLLGGYSHYPKK